MFLVRDYRCWAIDINDDKHESIDIYLEHLFSVFLAFRVFLPLGIREDPPVGPEAEAPPPDGPRPRPWPPIHVPLSNPSNEETNAPHAKRRRLGAGTFSGPGVFSPQHPPGNVEPPFSFRIPIMPSCLPPKLVARRP